MAQAYERPARRGQRMRIGAWAGAATLLLIPAIAMQFTREVDWSPADFVFAAVLLFGSLAAFEWLARGSGRLSYRVATGLVLFGVFAIVWINAAVGIIGSEDDPANWMFAAIPLVGGLVAMIGRFQPAAMMRASLSMAVVQLLIAAIAAGGIAGPIADSIRPLTGLTIILTTIWLAAATLFHRARD